MLVEITVGGHHLGLIGYFTVVLFYLYNTEEPIPLHLLRVEWRYSKMCISSPMAILTFRPKCATRSS